MNWNLWPNFQASEMTCRCGCGRAEMSPDFMHVLQSIRTEYGKPMAVTSGYRCPEHNARIGGGPEHPMGMAADIAVTNPDAHRLVEIAMRFRVPRIGVSQRSGRARFVHIGTSKDLPRAIWSY